MEGVYFPEKNIHTATKNLTLPYAFVIKTKSGEEFVVKTQSFTELSIWTFTLQLAHKSYLLSLMNQTTSYQTPNSIDKPNHLNETPPLTASNRASTSNSELSLPSPKFTPFHVEDITHACFYDCNSTEQAISLVERRRMKPLSLHLAQIEEPLPIKVPAPQPPARKESAYPVIRLLSPEMLNLC
ncbi:hypothetical protein HMI55_000026 [Coelomomyces lativittatus]|nr:hypothetical protein HMI55_000026 [Coelomomyces lativittatus]KAJ1514125.1 hypothetical protein HMI56_001119 [Coelomomyces lativittatus]